jgi:HEPN superfamily AbiU2-like protein
MASNKVMPAHLQKLWDALRPEVLLLHERWLIYRQLFADSQHRVDLLNDSASTFFLVVEDVLFESIQLGFARLGDPAQSGTGRNLTLESLLNEVKKRPQDAALLAKLTVLLHKYRTECSKLKRIRNKKLAHLDRQTILGRKRLTNPSRNEIEHALTTLRDFVNSFDLYFGIPEMAYEKMILRDDGNALVHVLKQGLRYRDLLKMRIIDWTDIQKSRYYKA